MASVSELKQIALLGGLTQDELEQLATVTERRDVARGARVLRANAVGQCLMFVLAGTFKVELVGADGRSVTLNILEPGDIFGEISLLLNEPRTADVEALQDGTLLVLSRDNFEQHILQHLGLTVALLRELAFRLRHITEKVGDLVLLDVYRRVARVLLSLSTEQRDEDGKTVQVIAERPTHRELAALAGTTREMVTRALKELEAAGHISVDGKQITLLSLPARVLCR